MKTYEWRLKLIAGKDDFKGVIQAKTLRSAKRHASIDSGADKWGKKWLLEPAGHVKYDGDAAHLLIHIVRTISRKLIMVLREVDEFSHTLLLR